MPSLKASTQGKSLIKRVRTQKIEQAKKEILEKQALLEKGWNEDDAIFLKAVSKFLEPNKDWEFATHYVISPATWKRFKEAREPIDAETFKVCCQVLGLHWENVADLGRDLSEAPLLSTLYGRTQELGELEQWLLHEGCRLVVIHGVGGIGKAALARQLVENIADKYDYLIWRSLNSTPPFQKLLTELIQFLSKSQANQDNILSLLMNHLRQHRCLIVLEDWEEIMSNNDYSEYCDFLKRVAREVHHSSVLLLSRERPQNIEPFEGQWVRLKKLRPLKYEDAKKILKAEGLSGKEDEQEEFSRRYSNPWILKRIATMTHVVFGGEISGVVAGSVIIDDVITEFLDQQFQNLSATGKTVIYWIAIRRNSASWNQLLKDTSQYLSSNQLFYTLNYLIQAYSLVDKNLEDVPILYILDPVILKYVTSRFVEESYQEICQIIQSQVIKGHELFITHSFITENPENEELTQDQIKRIVKPIKERLLTKLNSQQRVEEELKKIMPLLQSKGLPSGYADQNISRLL
ncbi:MAG: NACHT domain-containing protein [Goleter apudmare HA4340-LM2]|jgi:hypothetical protein|nr:NACHT domain-containing protein [Goleter apudmare HA4340-LM2]